MILTIRISCVQEQAVTMSSADLGLDIRKLAELIKNPDDDYDSSSEDDLPKSNFSKLGPGHIGQFKKTRITGCGDSVDNIEDATEDDAEEDMRTIWSVNEVPEVPFSDDASNDPRERPEYEMKYKQALSPEDIFLQMGAKTPGSASCEWMMVVIKMPGEIKSEVDCHIAKAHLDIRSPYYRLSLPLPQPVDPDTSTAEWDKHTEQLTVNLALQRELDFVNF